MSSRRPHLESALKLDLRRMLAGGSLRTGCTTVGTWRWTDSGSGQEVACVSYRGELGETAGTLTLSYSVPDRTQGGRKDIACRIPLSSIPLHYGGRRWYLHCPLTGRRAQTLHKWNGIDLFCHRDAIRPKPTYASQRVSGSERINAQRWAIRRHLGDDFSDLFGEPIKPKRMRDVTFARYADRDAALAAADTSVLRLLARLERLNRAR